MSTKKYCFVPETYKKISVYNPGTINTSKNSLTTLELLETSPSVSFKYCIDDYDKIGEILEKYLDKDFKQ